MLLALIVFFRRIGRSVGTAAWSSLPPVRSTMPENTGIARTGWRASSKWARRAVRCEPGAPRRACKAVLRHAPTCRNARFCRNCPCDCPLRQMTDCHQRWSDFFTKIFSLFSKNRRRVPGGAKRAPCTGIALVALVWKLHLDGVVTAANVHHRRVERAVRPKSGASNQHLPPAPSNHGGPHDAARAAFPSAHC